jgi:hypothetical protein
VVQKNRMSEASQKSIEIHKRGASHE